MGLKSLASGAATTRQLYEPEQKTSAGGSDLNQEKSYRLIESHVNFLLQHPTLATLWDGQREMKVACDRLDFLKQLENNESAKQSQIEKCRSDLLYWIEAFVWTYDPRRLPGSPLIPFFLFPRQKDYLLWRIERRVNSQNGICEKSRDSGMSWLNICHQVHCWLFEPGFAGGFGSRKEELVDRKGDPSSIFGKMRLLLRHLPPWMLPEGFEWKTHDNFKRLLNPETNSTIVGESGDNCGRGGRTSFYDWDEVAFTDHALLVEAALSNNTNVIYYTSSVNGHNFFYQKVNQLPPECRFRFHWRDDARKDDAWYEEQVKKFDPVIVASEIDINYSASVEGIYIPGEWVEAAIALDLPLGIDFIAALDVATTGKNLNVLGMRMGPVAKIIEAWNGTDTTQTAYKVRELVVKSGATHLNFDSDGVGAGVAGTLNSIPDLEFSYTPLHGSGRPSDLMWPEGKTSKEKFYNARAEWWGLLHDRFKKTYDHVKGAAEHPLDELISIPNHPALISQISQPKRKWSNSGKILVESKDEMAKRGLASPDFADMLAYLMAEEKKEDPVYDLFTAASPF